MRPLAPLLACALLSLLPAASARDPLEDPPASSLAPGAPTDDVKVCTAAERVAVGGMVSAPPELPCVEVLGLGPCEPYLDLVGDLLDRLPSLPPEA